MSDRFVYFDAANSTLLDDRVVEFMHSVMSRKLGNPSSHIHSAGIAAGHVLDEARAKIGALINARPETAILTSGATESNNLAISGFLRGNPSYGLVVSEIEHYSIINQARRLRLDGHKVDYLSVNSDGLIDTNQLQRVIKKGPSLVSVAAANPEIGTIQDIEEVGRICKQHGAAFHCDATAAAASINIDVEKMNIGMLTLSAHNMYGPTGIGALIINSGVNISPLFDGGNQQMGIRPGTENVVGAAGFGEACKIVSANRDEWNSSLTTLGESLREGLSRRVPFMHFTGHPEKRLPGHVSFWVEHVEGESLLLLLNMNGVMAASGSACSSNLKGKDEEDLAASHVLTAVGVPTDICAGSITFSLGKYNDSRDVDHVLSLMPGIVEKLLAMSPSYSDYMRKKEILHG